MCGSNGDRPPLSADTAPTIVRLFLNVPAMDLDDVDADVCPAAQVCVCVGGGALRLCVCVCVCVFA